MGCGLWPVVRLDPQSCPTPCDPMGCSPPGPSVQEIFQARILEWIAISYSRSYQYDITIYVKLDHLGDSIW